MSFKALLRLTSLGLTANSLVLNMNGLLPKLREACKKWQIIVAIYYPQHSVFFCQFKVCSIFCKEKYFYLKYIRLFLSIFILFFCKGQKNIFWVSLCVSLAFDPAGHLGTAKSNCPPGILVKVNPAASSSSSSFPPPLSTCSDTLTPGSPRRPREVATRPRRTQDKLELNVFLGKLIYTFWKMAFLFFLCKLFCKLLFEKVFFSGIAIC